MRSQMLQALPTLDASTVVRRFDWHISPTISVTRWPDQPRCWKQPSCARATSRPILAIRHSVYLRWHVCSARGGTGGRRDGLNGLQSLGGDSQGTTQGWFACPVYFTNSAPLPSGHSAFDRLCSISQTALAQVVASHDFCSVSRKAESLSIGFVVWAAPRPLTDHST